MEDSKYQLLYEDSEIKVCVEIRANLTVSEMYEYFRKFMNLTGYAVPEEGD